MIKQLGLLFMSTLIMTHVYAADNSTAQLEKTPPPAEGVLTINQIPPVLAPPPSSQKTEEQEQAAQQQ